MNSAIQTALSGLITAGQSIERSAATIAGGSTQETARPEPVSRSKAASRPEMPVPAGLAAAADPGAPSLSDGLFAAKQAEIQYQASAKLLGALSDTQKEALDILS